MRWREEDDTRVKQGRFGNLTCRLALISTGLICLRNVEADGRCRSLGLVGQRGIRWELQSRGMLDSIGATVLTQYVNLLRAQLFMSRILLTCVDVVEVKVSPRPLTGFRRQIYTIVIIRTNTKFSRLRSYGDMVQLDMCGQ